ncbi:hypothetical protein QYF61_007132 [Mycteria americana]|uniref:Glycerol kinase n=1 Tax=Mycteria americana TaxID=33587 RepID=A0AAN7P4I8_MYCAM|nr:hypothetical protein QYF61_007132 [Mycteria americana]
MASNHHMAHKSFSVGEQEVQRGTFPRAHCWLMFSLVSSRTTKSFSAKLFSSWSTPSIYLVSGLVPPQVQDFALHPVELYEVPVSPFLQPVQVPLDGSTTLWHISHSPQFCVICKRAEGTLCPIIQIINEDVKQDCTRYSMECRPHSTELRLLEATSNGVQCYKALVLMGDFKHPDICWRNYTAEHKESRRFLECTDNFFLQVIEEPIRRGILLDLILTKNEGLIENVKVKGSLGCSDHEMVEFRILMGGRRLKSKLTTLDFRRADFGLFKDLLGRVPWDKALEGKEAHKSWLIFKDDLL